ncbi:MAG: helix-turn-helix domain-containing protein [Allorhizobium sp.]
MNRPEFGSKHPQPKREFYTYGFFAIRWLHRIRPYGQRVTDSQDTSFSKPPPHSPNKSGRALRSTLAVALADTLSSRKLSQIDAARICATDQPTLSKVLKGRNVGVTVDKLFCWLAALGCDIEVHVNRAPGSKAGDVRAVIHD